MMINPIVLKVVELEREWSQHNYTGHVFGPSFRERRGAGPVLISAPHATNHWRGGNVKAADCFTGALACYVASVTGCHAFYARRQAHADPNHDKLSEGDYKSSLMAFAKEQGVRLVIDLHGSAVSHVFGIEMGTSDEHDSSLCGNAFVKDVLRFSFEKHLGDDLRFSGKAIQENVRFRASSPETITRCVSSMCGIACIQLEVSRLFRDPCHPDAMVHFINALTEAIRVLNAVDWDAGFKTAYKAQRSLSLIPHEVVRVCRDDETVSLQMDGARFTAIGPIGQPKPVVCHEVWGENRREYDRRRVEQGMMPTQSYCIYLTNRVCSLICGEGEIGGPVVLSMHSETRKVGIPKAEQIDRITLSEPLYNRLCAKSDKYEFYLCNRATGRRLFVDPHERRYSSILSEEKVMVPRYYRSLLGFSSLPLNNMTKEFYRSLLEQRNDGERELICRSYVRSGRFHYTLDKEISDTDYKALKGLQEELSLADSIDIYWVPRPSRHVTWPTRLFESASGFVSNLPEWLLGIYVGYREQELHGKVSDTADDRHEVARVSTEILTLLGAADNDKLVISYRNKRVSVRVLAGELDNETITIPAPVRMALEMTNPDDLVCVRRNVRHTFMQNSFNQSMTIIGNALAAFSLTEDALLRCMFLIVGLPITFYLMFADERGRIR